MERKNTFFLVSGKDEADLSVLSEHAEEIKKFADKVKVYPEVFMSVHVLTPEKVEKLKKYCQEHGLSCEAMPERKLKN